MLTHLQPPKHYAISQQLKIDANTRAHLKISASAQNPDGPTLFSVLDHCQTIMGQRRLCLWLNNPTRCQSTISERQDAIASLMRLNKLDELQDCLAGIGDCERVLTRISLGSARPRDCLKIRELLRIQPRFKALLAQHADSVLISTLEKQCHVLSSVLDKLEAAIVDNPPSVIRDGGVIAEGYDTELDELRNLRENSEIFLKELEDRERAACGHASLKVGYNRVHGYFIELSKQQALSAPEHFIRRQTLKNTERFITEELKAFEDKALHAQHEALQKEKKLYDELIQYLQAEHQALNSTIQAICDCDTLFSFTQHAIEYEWCQPKLSQDRIIDIKSGRHPILETILTEKAFIPNDTLLNHRNNFTLITGPNMGGKSTYMRQVAQIVLLAHCGAYVPASCATIGAIDAIYTRIGASDDLSSGRSTFMVEMTEAANILHNATANSLVIMDEIGRGTSTLDGLSIAWATAKMLTENIACLTLFATHYFELTQFADTSTRASNAHLTAQKHGDNIVFLHQVMPGSTNQSFGLDVAKLAGVPKAVIEDAISKCKLLETHPTQTPAPTPPQQTGLFDAPTLEKTEQQVLNQLQSVQADQLSAKEALMLVYDLTERLQKKETETIV